MLLLLKEPRCISTFYSESLFTQTKKGIKKFILRGGVCFQNLAQFYRKHHKRRNPVKLFCYEQSRIIIEGTFKAEDRIEKLKMKSNGILWTIPRSMSTAIVKSVSQLKGVTVIHEPFVHAFHLGPERWGNTYQNLEPNADYSFEGTFQKLQQALREGHVFIKELSYFLKFHRELMLCDEFKSCKHIFLIRNPDEVCRSIYKLWLKIPNAIPGSVFTEDTAVNCFVWQEEHYNFVAEHLEKDPLVIDAADLLEKPAAVMKKICSTIGLEFEENMLQWEEGMIPGTETLPWNPAFENASRSTAFSKRFMNKIEETDEATEKLLKDAAKKCMESYKALYTKRFIP